MKSIIFFFFTVVIITGFSCGGGKKNTAFKNNPEINLQIDFIYPNNVNDFPLNGNVIVLFNNNIKTSSVTSSTFKITRDGTSETLQGNIVPFEDKRILIYDIDTPIQANSNYTISLEGIQDTEGHKLQLENYKFMSAASNDTTPPNPVLVHKSGSEFQIKFKPDNIIIDPSTLNATSIKIHEADAPIGDPGIKCDAVFNVSEQVLYIWPEQKLAYYDNNGELIQYYIELKSNVIKSLAGTELDQDVSLFFKLVDGDIIPRLSSSNYDNFGKTVAMSGDGQTIVAGAPFQKSTFNQQGAVYVYTNGQLTNPHVLLEPDCGDFHRFGSAVAISDDGQTIVVGAPGFDGSVKVQGAVYVYTNGQFTNPIKIMQPNGASANYFGNTVSVSGDGNVVITGAYGTNNSTGCAYVYVNGQYNSPSVLVPNGSKANDYFGYSVAVSNDGATVVIGAIRADSNLGAAYVYANNQYTNFTKLVNSNGVDADFFGKSIAISNNGSIILVGSDQIDIKNTNDGGVFLYSNFDFNNPILLKAHDGKALDLFGTSIAVSNDGNFIIVGALQGDGVQVDKGAIYLFLNNDYNYPQKLTSDIDTVGDCFGESVDLANDGSLIVGAPHSDIYNTNDGAFYFFQLY